jgi:hypothetical protein
LRPATPRLPYDEHYSASMPDYSHDDAFAREWEHQYRRSVHAATAAAYDRAAGHPVETAYVALCMELQEHGIEIERDAVYSGAVLISRGERPPILRSGPHHHIRHLNAHADAG